MNPFRNMGQIGLGIALGIGATILIPTLSKVLAGAARPLIKESIKGGMYLKEKASVVIAEAKEAVEDLAAEVKAEQTVTEKKSKAVAHAKG